MRGERDVAPLAPVGRFGVVGAGADAGWPGAGSKMEGIPLGETTIAEFLVVIVEDDRDAGPLVDLVKVNDGVAVCLVVILDSEAALDVGDPLTRPSDRRRRQGGC